MTASSANLICFCPWQDLIHQLVQAIEKARKENSWNEFIYAVGDEPGSSVVRINTVKNIAQAIKKAAPHARILAAFNGEWHGADADCRF